MNVSGDSPLLGRRSELAELADAIRGAARSRGRVVGITGEAGIGKTRLAEEAAAIAATDGFRVVAGRSWDGSEAPRYWPWIEMLRALAVEPGAEALRIRLSGMLAAVVEEIPELRDDLSPDIRSGGLRCRETRNGRFPVYDALRRLLHDLSTAEPLFLLFDDLHAADEASLELLRFVARSVRHERILIVTAFRDEDLNGRLAVRRQLVEISREGFTLPLRGLRGGEVRQAVAARLDGDPPDGLVEGVLRATGGNPLFVDETLRELRSTGTTTGEENGIPVPVTVREAVRRKLDGLSEAGRAILEVAAVHGGSFDVDTLTSATGLDVGPARETLEALAVRGIVRQVSVPLGRYEFAQGLVARAIQLDLEDTKRAALHGRLGEILEGRVHSKRDPAWKLVAAHYFEAIPAGYRDAAVRAAATSARGAAERFDREEAVAQFRRAIEACGETGTPRERRRKNRLAKELRDVQVRHRNVTVAGGGSEGVPTREMPSSAPERTDLPQCHRQGDYWSFEYAGRSVRFRATRGFDYLAFLLRNPDVEVSAIDLVRRHSPAAGEDASRTGDLPPGDAGEVIDEQARREYRERLSILRDDLEEAERNRDTIRASHARHEMETLTAMLGSAYGLGGRSRKAAWDLERARVAVTKPVRDALRKILEVEEPLGRHLQGAVATGYFCVYAPRRTERVVSTR